MNVSHSYKKSGSYSVRLRVTDSDGAFSDDTSIWIKVKNIAPTVVLSSNRTTALVGGAMAFCATGNDTPTDMLSLKYTWNFGDGATATGASVTHAYLTEGKYNVRVEVSDPEGEKAEALLTVYIYPAKKPAPAQPGGPNITLLVGGAVAAAAIAAVVLVVLLRRRK
jgi:PKD repeat protein